MRRFLDTRRILVALAVAVAGAALFQTVSADDDDESKSPIVGMWEFEVDIGFIPPFPAMTTFLSDGVTMGFAGAHPPGRTVTGSQGIWRRRGRGRFEMVMQAFQLVDGVLFVTFRRFQTLRMTGPDTLEGEFTSEIIFPDGSPPIPGNGGKVKARRLRFED